MKKNPDISIIVPIYNTGTYIRKCLDSLVSQQKKELEFLLINDGSTDNSEEIIKEYKDKRIKYYKNKNQGIGKTRNFGIDKATGKYLMFCDSDDYLAEDTCEKLFKKATKDNLDLVICNFYRETEDGVKKEENIISFKNTTLKETPKLLKEINASPWNKLYKTSLIKNNNLVFHESLKYEDTAFVFIALDKAKKIGKIDDYLNHYIIHGNSETTVRDKRCFDIFEIVKIVREYFKEKEYAKEYLDKWTVWIITNFTIQQKYQKDKGIAKEFINEAFSYLEENIPDYKDNKYYEGRGIIRRTIEKNKFLTTIYCTIFN